MARTLAAIALALLLVSCGSPSTSSATSPTPGVANSPSPSAAPTPSPLAQLGPGGLTLDEEIGAVMMVGFQGQLTDAVLADWRQHPYGGLLVVNNNHNASSTASMQALITAIRAADRHRLIAATDQEGAGICIALISVPCSPMPLGAANTTRMAAALRAVGFDLGLGPVSDVCSGTSSIMWGRCYGTDPNAVSRSIAPVVDGIHAAHMLSAAKHFPGHGDTSVSSETQLPRIDESLATLRARDVLPFSAAIARGVDFILLGHLFSPALDAHHSADLSPATFRLLRTELGFNGAIISD